MKFAHNVTKHSENKDLNQSFNQLTYYGNLQVNVIKKWKFKTIFDYQTYSDDSFRNDIGIPLLSASISRNILKFDRGQLKVYMFDILNESTGVNRVNDFNYIEDQRYNAMSRYLMFSFTYSLSKFG